MFRRAAAICTRPLLRVEGDTHVMDAGGAGTHVLTACPHLGAHLVCTCTNPSATCRLSQLRRYCLYPMAGSHQQQEWPHKTPGLLRMPHAFLPANTSPVPSPSRTNVSARSMQKTVSGPVCQGQSLQPSNRVMHGDNHSIRPSNGRLHSYRHNLPHSQHCRAAVAQGSAPDDGAGADVRHTATSI